MKLLKNFFTLVMVFTLIACSSDDDSVPYELNNTNLSAGSYGIQYLIFLILRQLILTDWM